MTDILLHTTLKEQTELRKINKSLYYDQKNKVLYRLAFLPHGAIFYNEVVIQPNILALTRCDPHFAAINLLATKNVDIESVPDYLSSVNFGRLSDESVHNSKRVYIYNQGKVFEFLENKVAKLHQCFQEHIEQNVVKTEKKQKKSITAQIIQILKTEIEDHSIIDLLARERYAYIPIRRRMIQDEEEEQHFVGKVKSKPKKQTKKQEPKLQHNQKTLNSFFQKK